MCDQRYAEFLVRKLHVDTHPALLIPGVIIPNSHSLVNSFYLIYQKIQAAVDQFQHMDPAEIIDHVCPLTNSLQYLISQYLKQEQRLRTQKLIRKVGFYPRNDTPGVELLCPIPNRPLRVAKSEADAIFNRLHTSNTSYTSKRSDASVNVIASYRCPFSRYFISLDGKLKRPIFSPLKNYPY